jgi:hypothetical protein
VPTLSIARSSCRDRRAYKPPRSDADDGKLEAGKLHAILKFTSQARQTPYRLLNDNGQPTELLELAMVALMIIAKHDGDQIASQASGGVAQARVMVNGWVLLGCEELSRQKLE